MTVKQGKELVIDSSMTLDELKHGAYSLAYLLALVFAAAGAEPKDVTPELLHALRVAVDERAAFIVGDGEGAERVEVNLSAVSEYADALYRGAM